MTYAVGSTDQFAKKYGAKSNQQISEKYPSLVTPSGYAFAIWGPIFLLEGASVVWQCTREDKSLANASIYWCTGCLLQAGWTVAFAFDKIALSSIIIVCLAGTIGCTYASTTALRNEGTVPYILGSLPFAMHTAWLVAASLVNINLTAVKGQAGVKFLDSFAWSTETVAGLASAALAVWFNDPTFALVGAWALIAISKYEPPAAASKSELFNIPSREPLRRFARYSAYALGVLGVGLAGRIMLM